MADSHGGKLVVCATPIGNLGDVSPRLAKALAEADLIAGEIAGGAHVALVSDAGMPAVSDPGHDLIGACLERGLEVEVVPGPSAVLAALVVSGLPADRFCFEGFPPRKPAARARVLAKLAGERRTMVFFEAPHRVLATLDAMAAAFGPKRRCAVARELTKLHEQVLRGTLSEVRERLAEQGERGEFTLVVAGAPEAPAAEVDVVAEVAGLIETGASTRDAVDQVARATGRPRRAVYQAVLEAREFASLRGQDTIDAEERRSGGQGQSQERNR